ncbi:hypothetical protein EOD39_4314 [Acipenser ruthenus]|uniref:Uncharacterized protein n=1 Tax=Acipenser ruthenus TaxID=7906 RepID=A0A444UJ00_ACIRT|nr:hypothetical protein EOD39_4314 [Acipenser ruthenus]
MKNQLRCFTLNSPEEDEVRMQIQEDGTAGFIESENPERRGVENPSSTERWSIGRSVSSVSTTQRAKQRKKLTPLSSLPLQTCMKRGCKTSICSDEETEDLFGSSAGGLLTPPVINLIPPTPSDVIDDDQFFDINSEEECGTHTSGSECVDSSGSHATGDQESFMGGQDNIEALCGYQESELPLDPPRENSTARDLNENTWFQLVFERNKPLLKDGDRTRDGFARTPSSVVEADKSSSMRSIFQVAPLPRYPRKRSFNTGINLIPFTEQNLDDLNYKDMNPCERLKAELRLLPLITKMDPLLHSRKPVTRTCSLGDVSSARRTFQIPLRHSGKEGSEEEGSPPQRRITVGTNLQGPQIATIDLDTLDLLQLTSVEERENFLSAVYRELHPQDTTTQILDTLLETIGPHDVEKFTAALVNLSNANSQQHSDCVNTPCQFQHRAKLLSPPAAERPSQSRAEEKKMLPSTVNHLTGPPTLEAVNQAVAIEAMLQDEEPLPHQPGYQPTVRQVQPSEEDTEASRATPAWLPELDALLQTMSTQDSQSADPRTNLCWGCGQPGHL